MSATPFVHLHNHTDYSLLDGACEISQLLDLVEQQGMPAVAITDHGNLFGVVKFYREAQARGIKPIIGCEVYVAQQSRHVKAPSNPYNHFVLLCENEEGYRNLIQLVTAGFLEGFYSKPRIDKDLLAQHARGLIALSGCLRGDINEALLAGSYDQARRLAYEYLDIFGKGNFFLEIQNHGLDEDRVVIPGLVRLSQETGIPLVATNDSHYLRREDARLHEILLCIQTGKTLSHPNRLRFKTPDFYLKSREEMLALFPDLEDALDRTWEIAERCHFQLRKIDDPFPEFQVPPGQTTESYFEFVVRQGFEKRRPRLLQMWTEGRLKHDLRAYEERLEHEIRTIREMKFCGYFLIVWDFVRYAKSRGIPVGPGRGSAAGSLVAYALGITNIDPLQYGLLFERFLNPERISLPDIDIDFCTHRRDEVIDYVTEKYGRDRVAQIITFGTLGARAAIKDAGRALDMRFEEVDRLTKLIPNQLNIKLDEALEREPQLAQRAREDPRVAELIDIARKLEGMCRNPSVHAAGVVISPVPLSQIVPLYKTPKDEVVTQYDMSALEYLGLLKMDFLGLTTLTIIHDCLELIRKYRGIQLELDDIPLDDAETYRLFSAGHTSGVFQFESEGMRDILRRYGPTCIEHLIALNALYRPGPIQGGMIDDFIDRKHGRKKVTYELPELRPILEETYGVIVYQEQVMQISNILAGYTLGEADLLRRAMAKKSKSVMAEQRDQFIERAVQRGFPREKVSRIFDLMAQFAGYGFNKSHSAAYAYLAYITAYLKAHYPVEFMCALLTSEIGNSDKLVKYINECREMGIRVLPPDIQTSQVDFTPDQGAIRFGLCAIKNLGHTAVEAILQARQAVGRFRSLYHFCESVDLTIVNRRAIESLIRSGAMDSLPGSRAQKFAAIDKALEHGQRVWKDRQSGQTSLFGLVQDPSAPEPPLPDVAEWSQAELLAGEKETLGFYVTGHPLDAYADKIKDLATHTTASLQDLPKGTEVALCGLLTQLQRKVTRSDKRWAIVRLEDRDGSVEGRIFSSHYDQLAPELVEDRPVLVRGTILVDEDGQRSVAVRDITPLELARVQLPRLISIRVRLSDNPAPGTDPASQLSELFGRKPGEASVRLRLEKPNDFSVILDLAGKVRPDREFCAEVERICGPEALEILAD